MNDQPSPTIYVLAGPNGAGKTSLYQYEALAVPRLNGDSLYQQGLAVQEVEASLRQQLAEWTTQRISFVIETNAASERDYKLLSRLVPELAKSKNVCHAELVEASRVAQ